MDVGQILSGKEAYYDRGAEPVLVSDNQVMVSLQNANNVIDYTVPANKLFLVNNLEIVVTALNGGGTPETDVFINLNDPTPVLVDQIYYTFLLTIGGQTARQNPMAGMILLPDYNINIDLATGPTGGSAGITCTLSGTTFDQ